MESPVNRIYRQTLPPLRWRLALWLLVTYVAGYLHAAVRPHILRSMPAGFLRELYVRITSAVLVTCTAVIIGVLVASYYVALRDRQIHTSMSELGLAVRAVVAGVFGLAGFVLVFFINDGSFLH